ncbi:MAG TPA: protein kinase, partial [Rubrobacter sp.]|nr:protein kinase [Rubrobacter sp.]
MLGEISGGRYALLELLGSGGMAEVFLAHDRILGRDLALKVLREHYAEDADFISRFQREAVSAASLNHPHVVQVYDQGRSEDGRPYIAMEHVPGGTLKDLITRRGPLDPVEAALLASQVAEALGAAHERGIVHRDIKPQNVLIGESGEAKVADFGIALAASTNTTSGTNRVFGTATYMSPEQAMGGRVGPESDLYSLGVVLYEELTGVVPFEAEGALATAMKHVTERPVPPRERDPSVPKAMDALVMGLLAKDPEERGESAFELAEDLRKARAELPPAFFAGGVQYPETPREFVSSEGGAQRDSSESAPRRSSRPVAIGLVALAALLALLGAFGWNLTDAREASNRVGTVTTTVGSREGVPAAPEDSREGGSGKGVDTIMPSVDLAGGGYVPASSSRPTSASASASASAPASASRAASATPESPTSATDASEPWASAPQA